MKASQFKKIFLIKTLFASIIQANFDVSCNEDWKNGDVSTTTPFLKHYIIGEEFKEDVLVKVQEVNGGVKEELCSLVTIHKMSGKDCESISDPTIYEEISMAKKRGAMYERMLSKSGMVIDPSHYSEGFALIVLNYNSTQPCKGLSPSEPDALFISSQTDQYKTVSVNIIPNGTSKEYLLATLIPLSVFIIIFIVVIGITCYIENNLREPEIQDDTEMIQEPEDSEKNAHEETTYEGSKKKDDSYRSSQLYLSLIFIVGFFYALPAWSAVRYKMDEIDISGNMDICFYNSYCSKPLGVFKDFGHVFSNIGYIILGITFFFVIEIKKTKWRKIRFVDQCCWNFFSLGSPPSTQQSENGVLVQYGIHQALALALCMEGIMSSCYHICPTNNNFQFDTTFMYIMGFLIFIKIYQNRHPHQTPSSITTFFIISTAMCFVVMSRYPPSIQIIHTIFWVVFYFYYLGLIFYITSMSFQPTREKQSDHWKEDFMGSLKTLSDFKKVIFKFVYHCGRDMFFKCWKVDELQNIFTCIIFWVNIICLITDITLRLCNAGGDIADVLLNFFVGNGILYMLFYFITKCCLALKEQTENTGDNIKSKVAENPGKIRFFFLLLGIMFSAVALFYFKGYLNTDKAKSAAESREENSDCLPLTFNFYDAHDLWHMLGATGLFFLFLFILTLDDRTLYARREKLAVF